MLLTRIGTRLSCFMYACRTRVLIYYSVVCPQNTVVLELRVLWFFFSTLMELAYQYMESTKPGAQRKSQQQKMKLLLFVTLREAMRGCHVPADQFFRNVITKPTGAYLLPRKVQQGKGVPWPGYTREYQYFMVVQITEKVLIVTYKKKLQQTQRYPLRNAVDYTADRARVGRPTARAE